MSARKAVLIIGGYGTFGGRIVRLLESNADLTLIVAGRSLKKATAFCRSRGDALATIAPAIFDRVGDVERQLAAHTPDIVIDASGPFQAYGAGAYRVIEGCIAARVNYLDLADGSDFVAGVKPFDAAARSAGVFVLSGVSSFPVLTAAVVRRLAAGLVRIDSIRGGIAPSPFAGVGENVIRAIASYCGQPVPLKRSGRLGVGYPLTEHIRYTIAPPGKLPLRDTLFSLVDVPDLRALSDLWPEAASVWMGAGPVPEILHQCLSALSWLVRWKLVGSLTPIARLMHWATNHLRWGEHRGGMFVEIVGRDAQAKTQRRSWHLLAEGDDGPLIPSMAVEAIMTRILAGRAPSAGARAAVCDLEQEDYEALFAGRTIHTGVRVEAGDEVGLYRRLLGSAYKTLPPEILAMHDCAAAQGEASVDRGNGVLARLAAGFVGFPNAAPRVPVRVTFERSGGRETWTRTFGSQTFKSEQFAGTGKSERLLVERFGPLSFSMGLVVDGAKLTLKLRRWKAFGIPLPMWFCPESEAFESASDGLFRFHVEIGHPVTGLIVRYRGWLMPVPAAASQRDDDRKATALAP